MKQLLPILKLLTVVAIILTFITSCDRYQYPLGKVEQKDTQAEYDYKPDMNKSGEAASK